jgi:hypothetical protein
VTFVFLMWQYQLRYHPLSQLSQKKPCSWWLVLQPHHLVQYHRAKSWNLEYEQATQYSSISSLAFSLCHPSRAWCSLRRHLQNRLQDQLVLRRRRFRAPRMIHFWILERLKRYFLLPAWSLPRLLCLSFLILIRLRGHTQFLTYQSPDD